MKEKTKRWLRPVLFTAGGALAGFGYYYFIGCATGSCPITANPISSMIYMGVLGWLLSGVFGNINAFRSHEPKKYGLKAARRAPQFSKR